MKRLALCACLLMAFPAGHAQAAAADTVYVLGGPGTTLGKFQDATGTLPDRQGWIGVDLSRPAAGRWQVSSFNAAALDPAESPNLAMWCGQTFAAGCGGGDPAEGYANGYDESLDWRGTVANSALPTTVTVNAVFNNHSEPDYDLLWLEVDRGGTMHQIGTAYSGLNDLVSFSETFSVATADYVGTGLDEVHLRWRATSDAAWSDSDCSYPSHGLAQIDNIEVLFGGVRQSLDDFQPGSPLRWAEMRPQGVGDFSKAWPLLADLDPSSDNGTPQFAFIDDGVVVPGTGGSLGMTWTYGPGGYVVNLEGGLAGVGYALDNHIWSPPLDWPAGAYDGGSLEFDVYTHLPYDNGLYYVWRIRDSTDGGVTWGPWRDDNFVHHDGGQARYVRAHFALNTHLTPGRNKIQVSLGAIQAWIGFEPRDGTPAPYFDNVAVRAFTVGGPVGVPPDAVFTARHFPNPFNPGTKIEFTLPRAGRVELKIYNVRGELVKTLLNQSEYAAGTSSVVWDGRNSAGQSVSSGVYFYSLKSGSYEKMEKMTLVK